MIGGISGGVSYSRSESFSGFTSKANQTSGEIIDTGTRSIINDFGDHLLRIECAPLLFNVGVSSYNACLGVDQ